jgi:hypothetical protein
MSPSPPLVDDAAADPAAAEHAPRPGGRLAAHEVIGPYPDITLPGRINRGRARAA